MFISPAYAQTAGGGGPDLLVSMLPFVLIFAIMYFLLIRPQRQKMKQHEEMVANVRKGDTVVMSGGIIGKVTKVIDDAEIEIELSQGTRTRAIKAAISDVRAKGEPIKAD
ncbi:MAG: preprotein translocase subunit YajC [Pseudomonadota bacterium]